MHRNLGTRQSSIISDTEEVLVISGRNSPSLRISGRSSPLVIDESSSVPRPILKNRDEVSTPHSILKKREKSSSPVGRFSSPEPTHEASGTRELSCSDPNYLPPFISPITNNQDSSSLGIRRIPRLKSRQNSHPHSDLLQASVLSNSTDNLGECCNFRLSKN